MLRLEWTEPAADELEAAQRYYHELNPRAARTLARRIVEAARRLRERPQIGRPGLREGTREWVVSNTPYVLVYRSRNRAGIGDPARVARGAVFKGVRVIDSWPDETRLISDRHLGPMALAAARSWLRLGP